MHYFLVPQLILFSGLFFLVFNQSQAQSVDELIDVQIFSEVDVIKPGDNSRVLVKVVLKNGWHVYSKEAGESGFPTEIKWQVADSFQIDEVSYPKPELYDQEGIKSYIHKGDFFLHSKIYLSEDFSNKENEIKINAKFSALVCSAENCIPYEKDLSITIPVGKETLVSIENRDLFQSEPNQISEANISYKSDSVKTELEHLFIMFALVLVAMSVWALGKVKHSNKSSTTNFVWKITAMFLFGSGIFIGYPKENNHSDNGINWLPWTPEKETQFLSEGRGVFIDFTAKWCASCQINKRVYSDSDVIKKFKDLNIVPMQADWTNKSPVILDKLNEYGREGVPLYLYFPPSSNSKVFDEPILLPEIFTSEILLSVIENEKPYIEYSASNSFFNILGFAFMGGIILNLMPCVFPVLGLKIMSFVKQAGEDSKKIRMHGLVFTAGVVLSFWILVGILLGLRESIGQEIGWGFQLQEPLFVFFLAIFLLVFGLSLSGVFEIGISFVGLGTKLSTKSGYNGSFFSGFLATVVATPCMAPFLGVAVGAALTMPIFSALTIFTAIALGLSSPYLLFSVFPKLISRLPKPGAWMETLKEAMAFPIYATVAWLLWTLNSLI